MNKGYIHIYTGNGKGKTTAAFGLAVRAACSGKKVYIGQFVKDMKYSETAIEAYMPHIKIEQLGEGCFIDRPPLETDKIRAQQALQQCAAILKSGDYHVVILDEIIIAIYFKLLTVEEVINMLNARAEQVEVILTGRYAPDTALFRA